MNELEDLRAAADHAHHVLARVAHVAEQVASGSWDGDLRPEDAADLAARFAELAEAARWLRADAGLRSSAADPASGYWRGDLPFNRKERFFTGTVFPCLVGATGFWHLKRCLDLFGLDVDVPGGEFAQVQFLTEYGFGESLTPADRELWGDVDARDTPDIVLRGPDWLLAIEAKMFHNPNAAALTKQMESQQALVRLWQEKLAIPEDRVVHALLLPERLAARERAGIVHPVVTWEDLLAAYRGVGPPYWVGVLDEALQRHPELESRFTGNFMPNAETLLTGQAIVDGVNAGTLAILSVGRRNGLHGPELAQDVSSGGWRKQRYQVSDEAPANANWFLVEDFVAAVSAGG